MSSSKPMRGLKALRLSYGLVLRAGRPLVLATAAIALASSFLIAGELLLIRSIVDSFDAGVNNIAALAALAGIAALRRLLTVVGREAQWLAAEKVEYSVLEDVLEVSGRAPFADFELPSFQDSLSRSIRAGKEDVWGAAWGLFHLVSSVAAIGALVAILVGTAPELLAPFAAAAVGLGIVAVIKSRLSYSFEYADTEADRERQYLRHALVSRSEGREMRLFGTGHTLRSRHQTLFAERVRQLRKVLARRIAADGVAALALGIVLGACLILIGRAVENDGLALSAAAVAAVSAQRLAASQSQFFNGLSSVFESTRHVADLDDFLARQDFEPASPVASTTQALELDNVVFRYPEAETNALDGVSLRLERGSIVAVVGENGSGKTTVARLLLGLYQPTAGSARTIGIDGEASPITGPLVNVATAAFQDFARYELSVDENIGLGSSKPSNPERSAQLLRAVDLDSQVSNLPNGARTRLGRRFSSGQDLSIGQWQRLALARAAANEQADFVVLDEPSASLDPKMEAALFDRLRDVFPHQGVLLISHRMASLHMADHIIVMHEGVIAEQGSHAELLSVRGIYHSLHAQQVNRLGAGGQDEE